MFLSPALLISKFLSLLHAYQFLLLLLLPPSTHPSQVWLSHLCSSLAFCSASLPLQPLICLSSALFACVPYLHVSAPCKHKHICKYTAIVAAFCLLILACALLRVMIISTALQQRWLGRMKPDLLSRAFKDVHIHLFIVLL